MKKRERADYSENILAELNMEYLGKFYERAKKELNDYLDVFALTTNDMITVELLDPNNTSKMAELFLEVCYVSRITA